MKEVMPFGVAALMITLLGSCAQKNSPEPTVRLPVRQVSAVGLSPQPLGFYTQRLAQQLFIDAVKDQQLQQRQLAVSSFLPIGALTLQQRSEQEVELANQLADSMLTEAVQRGFSAVDIRLRQEVVLYADHEQGFSRQLADIRQNHRASALLSGTYSVQEDGYVVNVRLIDIESQQVLAAATDYIPDNVMWGAEKMRKRGKYLYRSDRIGERP